MLVVGCGLGVAASRRWTAACHLPSSSWMSSSADSSLSARYLEAEEWLRQVYHGGCPCVSSLYACAVCMCVRACVRVYLCACACVCVHKILSMQLALLSAVTYWIANRVASRLQALVGGRCATTCACPRGGAGTCVQWTSSVVLSSVLSSVLYTFVCASPTPQSRHAHRAAPRYLAPNYC
jgi:hypothetical protein